MTLSDDIIIYPGHGAGSACGKNMSNETIGTLGEQKHSNYALRADMKREEFIKEVTEGILPPPQYFPKNAVMNKMGYNSFDDVLSQGSQALDYETFRKEVDNGALILDVRTQAEFIKGFIPGALFIGLNGTFAMWVGALIEDIHREIVLIIPEDKLEDHLEEAVTRLARVGYDHAVGYLKGGVKTYVDNGGTLSTITSIPASDLATKIDSVNLVDVRKPGEYDNEHVETAMHYPLDYMNDNLNKLDKDKTYHVHCAGGYRSVIAISLLMQNGYTKLIDISGGYGAIKQTNIPRSNPVCSSSK